jgi:predicted esterase YcpF (UPF0227 family)
MPLSPPITHLLYLHGFRSSPQSKKACAVARHLAVLHPQVIWYCPQLPASPREAMRLVMQAVADWPRATMAVIGSSLGGFYASWVAQATGCRAVLLNPAVDPARDLQRYIGEQSQWHDPQQRFYFQSQYVELRLGALSQPERCLAIIAKGDELLDWREMRACYVDAQLRLIEGGDHALSDFDVHLPAVMTFLGLH